MKVSVFMSTHNKNKLLPNAMYAISRQVVDFPVEFCIIDDNSDVDPLPIIHNFLPKDWVKYKRLEKHVGFMYAQSKCFELMSPDTDVIILQSCDVIPIYPYTYKILTDNVGDRMPVLPCTVDMPIDEDLWKNDWDNELARIDRQWEKYITAIDLNIKGDVYKNSSTLYTGRPGCSWLFFLGSIFKDNLMDLGYHKGGCDAMLSSKMKQLGYQVKMFPLLKVIHQRHEKTSPLCPIIDRCDIHCIRKTPRWQNWNKERIEKGEEF